MVLAKQSSDLVLVAHVNGSAGSPRTVRLKANASGKFEAQWFDPATGSRLPAGELSKGRRFGANLRVY